MRLPWRPPSQAADPDHIRRQLEETFAAGDLDGLEALSRKHVALIESAFPAWWADRPPIEDPARLDAHVQGFGNIAFIFRDRLGRPELLASITGPPDSNPILDFHAALSKGAELLASGDEDAAADIGRTVLGELDALLAGNIDEERAQAMFLIGSAAFRSGKVTEAREPLELALDIYRTSNAQPSLPFLLTMFDIYRYLGEGRMAAVAAEVLAEHLPGSVGAFYSRQASIVRIGEPALRVIARIGDDPYEIDDAAQVVRASNGLIKAQIQFQRNRPSIARAVRLTDRGMTLAAHGDHAGALDAFDEATDVDPFDPQPAYQVGVVMLEQGRWSESHAAFAIADGLAPGWFFARRYAWLAREVAESRVRPATTQVVIRTGDSGDPERRLHILESAIADDPELGLLHLYAGQAEWDRGQGEAAIGCFRRGLAARAEADVRAALQLALGFAIADSSEGQALLRHASRASGSPYSAGLAQLALAVTARDGK